MSISIDLTGKKAVITGGRKGIGGAIATAFAKAGADVTVTGRDVQTLQTKQQELQSLGVKAYIYALDVRHKANIDAFFKRLYENIGEIDILVNNAGVEQVQPSKAVDEEIWDKIVDTNLKGAFFCARAFANLPYQKVEKQQRSILNICSLTSSIGIPTAVPYGSSKSGLVGMTKALSSEWAGEGIRVNGIAPGYFYTDMTAGFYESKDWERTMLEKIPMKRFGELEDLMGASLFLSTPLASYITGQILYIDGGFISCV